MDHQQLEAAIAVTMKDDFNPDYRDDGYITLVLRIMGLMCDGQNKTLQVCKYKTIDYCLLLCI